MKLKRTLAVLMLALIVALCGAFTACSDSGVDSGNNNPPQSGNEQTTPDNPDEGNEDNDGGQEGSENEGNQDNEGDQGESGNQDGEEEEPIEAGDILIVYFSVTGNTEMAADQIATITGGELFEIQTQTDYATHTTGELYTISQDEFEKGEPRYPIINRVEEIEQYETIFIGFPIWFGREPQVIDSFLESDEYDFSNKNIVPFSTSASSGGSNAYRNIENICTASNVLEGFNVTNSIRPNAETELRSWLTGIGIL